MSGIYGTRDIPRVASRSKSSPSDEFRSLNGNRKKDIDTWKFDVDSETKKIPYQLSGVVIERTRTLSGGSEARETRERDFEDGKLMANHNVTENEQQSQSEVLERNYETLMKQLATVLVEKETLAYQVQLLGQAYGELKHQLSTLAENENRQPSRLECLKEERHRLADYIVALSDTYSTNAELRPPSSSSCIKSLSIQRDLWRNKFLANSLIVDELSNQRLFLLRQFDEAQRACNGILDEKEAIREKLFDAFLYLQEINETLDPSEQGKYRHLATSHSLNDLLTTCQELTRSLHKRLLNTNRNPAKGLFNGDGADDLELVVVPSEIEKEARKIVSLDIKELAASNPCENFQRLVNERSKAVGLPPPKMHNIVINCCKHCIGQVKVL